MKALRTIVVKDTKGNEVKASDISNLSIEMFERGNRYTLRNKDHTFWADVECISKRNNVYTFESVLYGDRYKVDFNNNTVTRTEYSI